ncbi:MAG TPA: hypothetical protein VEW74_09320, partial [Candidatus Nitrosotalea sp.]|nr:hypothetical protein [Candidatus Nitrosotalea sp.]
ILSGVLTACSSLTQSFAPLGNSEKAPGAIAGSMDSWHVALTQYQLPSAGCFKAVYPSVRWDRIACSAPPHHWYPVPPSLHRGPAQVVGGGNDYTANTDPNLISKAIGSFPKVEGVKRVRSVGCCGVQGRNSYTLQLNSDFFPTSACASIPYCGGWEQFVFENPPHSLRGFLFIEDWLVPMPLGRGGLSGCPPSAGWQYVGIGCVQNSQAVRIPNVSVKDLGQVVETGRASLSGDSIYLSVGSTEYGMRKIQGDGVVDLAANWDGAEFNIVGDAGGDIAKFNAGSTITVNLQTDIGQPTKPTCLADSGTTGETNNLYFIKAPKNPPPLRYPSIEFTMSSTSAGNPSCDARKGT